MTSFRLLISLLLVTSSTLWACEFDSVKFHRDFSAAAVDSCEQVDKFEYDLWFKPENTPINPSAWYAFKVTAKTNQAIRVNLKYRGEGRHRYSPKVSQDGRHWQALSHEVKQVERDGKEVKVSAHFQLAVSDVPVWVSAQEIINVADYDQWITKLEKHNNLKRYEIGQSVNKRPIWALESKVDSNRWLVLIGRQHPPEVTGALAMLPFVETVMSDLSVAKTFRQQYNLLIIPLVNPDGVERGHWRHNVGGKDLNRDWAERTQPEIQGIHKRLQEIVANGGKIEFALDFHSTWKNLFYTIPTDYGLEQPEFSEKWLKKLAKTLPNFDVDERPGVSDNPGVFKQYIADTYGVHSVTYEVDDHADRNEISNVAKTSAMLLMQQMSQ